MTSARAFLLASLCLGFASRAEAASKAWEAYLSGDHAKAFKLARPEADAGNYEAEGLLGWLYWDGDQVPKDRAQAQTWFTRYAGHCRKAAERGEKEGENGMGWLYEKGWGGLGQDFAEAAKWYRKAAEKGFQYSQHSLGWLYQNGWGVKKDYSEAATWYRKAADQGNKYSQFGLGWLYQNGWGVTQDWAEAAKLYRAAADSGNPDGQHALAALYYFGLGLKQDLAEAGRWWAKADQAGSIWAPWGLGLLYRDGLGGFPKDYAQALRQFRTGVERGDMIYSGAGLGALYENGEGVAQDFVQAYKWYLLSAARDNASAREGMARLRQSMTKEQVAEAQKLASAFEAPPEPKPAMPAPKTFSSDVDAPGFQLKENASSYALVVGIDKYKDLPPAEFAERDADAVRRNLLAMGYPERNVVELKGSEATIASLKKYLDEWLPKNAREGSTVFFYFSGHGAPDPKDGSSYLVPWDGDASYLKSTAYPLKNLYATLSALKAKAVFAALDACFSGTGGRSVLAKGARPLVLKQSASAVPQGLTVFAAASGEQITSTLEDQGHGTFTYYFLKGLSGAAKEDSGAVTAQGLHDYLKPKVQDAARRQNRDQEPSLHSQSDRELIRF